MQLENASGLPEGQDLPAENQQTATGAENQGQQQEQKTFTQAELDEKVQKRVARAERKAQADIAALRQEIEALKSTPKPAEKQTDSAPKREEFSSYEDFVEARALHVARQEAKKELEAYKSETKQKAESDSKAQAQEKFKQRVADVIEAGQKNFADFDAVINDAVEDGHLPASGALYEAIMDSEIGDKLAYHLAKSPAEAKRIQGLSVFGQLRELGKLEDKLSAKKEPREAMEPVGGRNSSTGGLRDDQSTDAWIKARNKQVRESRGL